jgi:hypothetical protein
MRLPEFRTADAKWDRYKRFHVTGSHGTVHFESGEMIFTSSEFNPFYRNGKRDNVHENCSLRVTSTADDDCPALYLSAEALTPEVVAKFAALNQDVAALRQKAIPKTWLAKLGQQMLIIDSDTGRAVTTNRSAAARHKAWKNAPSWIAHGVGYPNNAAAYIPGQGKGVIAAGVTIDVPYKPTTEERAQARELGRSCTAWCSLLTGDTLDEVAPKRDEFQRQSVRGGYGYTYCCPYWKPYELGETIPDYLDLIPEVRLQIANYGFGKSRTHTFVIDSATTNQGE